MPKTDKKQTPPTLAEVLQAFNVLAGQVQEQGQALKAVAGVMGIGITAEGEGGNGAVPAEDEGNTGAKPGDNPYDLMRMAAAQRDLRLVNLGFDVQDDKLPEYTETPRAQVQCTAAREAMDIYVENLKQGKYEPLTKLFIRCRDRRMLSVSRRLRQELMIVHQQQRETERAEAGQDMSI